MVTWEELEARCRQCQNCPLSETRTNVVFGVGNRQADILFIGEGPGEQEDLQGEPFVGPAGKLLDLMLSLIDLDRSKVYIANIVKCRPPRNLEHRAGRLYWLSPRPNGLDPPQNHRLFGPNRRHADH